MNFYASRKDAEIESLEILHSAFININLFYHHNNDRNQEVGTMLLTKLQTSFKFH